jgi:hypothetical protein
MKIIEKKENENLFTIDAEFLERRRAKDLAASFFSATLSTRCMTILNTIEVNLIQSSTKKRKRINILFY